MRSTIGRDLEAMGLEAAPLSFVKALAIHPGFRTVLLYRLSHWLYSFRPLRVLAWLVFNLNHALSGCELKPSAAIGYGFFLPHATGIVIGERVVIGEWCTLYQNTTLGRARPGELEYPVLGDRVNVFVGACVLGGIRIGDGATVGAHAVVLTDVPPNSLAVGAPARIIPPRRAEGNKW